MVGLKVLERVASALTPGAYLESLGYPPFEWQNEVLPDITNRWVMLLCARQSGKTHSVGGKCLHKAKHRHKSFCVVVAPSQDQSKLVMRVVEELSLRDGDLPALKNDNEFNKRWVTGSEIKAFPGTERSVRGSSAPDIIIFDEGTRILDETYAAVTPMTTAAGTQVIACSTAFGRRGWFYRNWTNPKSYYHKVLVRIPWDPVGDKLVDAMPEPEFKAMWAEKGVAAYYSKRHVKWEVQRDLDDHGEQWIRQEYCCEFLEDELGLFRHEDIVAAFRNEQRDIFAPQLQTAHESGGRVF